MGAWCSAPGQGAGRRPGEALSRRQREWPRVGQAGLPCVPFESEPEPRKGFPTLVWPPVPPRVSLTLPPIGRALPSRAGERESDSEPVGNHYRFL